MITITEETLHPKQSVLTEFGSPTLAPKLEKEERKPKTFPMPTTDIPIEEWPEAAKTFHQCIIQDFKLKYRLIRARYRGICDLCGQEIRLGQDIWWYKDKNLNQTFTICHPCFVHYYKTGQIRKKKETKR